jgi:hypothetical protein
MEPCLVPSPLPSVSCLNSLLILGKNLSCLFFCLAFLVLRAWMGAAYLLVLRSSVKLLGSAEAPDMIGDCVFTQTHQDDEL